MTTPRQDIVIKQRRIKAIQENLSNLITESLKIRSLASQDVQFRQFYGIDTVKRQVKDQASTLYGKLIDEAELVLPWDLAHFAYIFVDGNALDRFNLSKNLRDRLDEALKILAQDLENLDR